MINWKLLSKGLDGSHSSLKKKTVTTNFGFKSVKTPPKNEQLSQFESDFYDMVQNIKFRKVIYSSENLFNNQHYSN